MIGRLVATISLQQRSAGSLAASTHDRIATPLPPVSRAFHDTEAGLDRCDLPGIHGAIPAAPRRGARCAPMFSVRTSRSPAGGLGKHTEDGFLRGQVSDILDAHPFKRL